MAIAIWYTTVYVHDFERAVAFYRDALGFRMRFQDERFGYASLQSPGGAQLGIARIEPGAPNAGELVGRHTGIGLGVENLDAVYEELVGRGVRFEQAPQEMPWGGRLAILLDPDGNQLFLDQVTPI